MQNEESIFAAAVEQATPEARSAFLDAACAGNAALRARIEGLLWAHEHPDSFLDAPENTTGDKGCAHALDVTVAGPVGGEPVGTTIGPYKLLQQIGEGGMGTVYMAEQTEPVQRRVALKLIKPGLDTRDVIARFEAERQALALMDHPNIAKVLDAGTTADWKDEGGRMKDEKMEGASSAVSSFIPHPLAFSVGRPYFVMELVNGIPLMKYCDEHRLTPRERLELFIPVCQ